MHTPSDAALPASTGQHCFFKTTSGTYLCTKKQLDEHIAAQQQQRHLGSCALAWLGGGLDPEDFAPLSPTTR